MHLLRCLMLIFQKFLFKVLINLFIIIFLFYFCSLVASEVEEPPLVDNLNDKEYLKKNFLLLDNLFKKKLISNTNLFANEIKTVESFSDDILLKYIKKN